MAIHPRQRLAPVRPLKQELTTFTLKTQGQGLYDFTVELAAWVHKSGIETGLLTVFCRHTSASLIVQENADPDVLSDLQDFFKTLVREDGTLYRHANEGLDDMPAHIRSCLTNVSLSIPVSSGRPVLGTWQGVFLFEHRSHNQTREVVAHILGS